MIRWSGVFARYFGNHGTYDVSKSGASVCEQLLSATQDKNFWKCAFFEKRSECL